jgi:hypothetical protein
MSTCCSKPSGVGIFVFASSDFSYTMVLFNFRRELYACCNSRLESLHLELEDIKEDSGRVLARKSTLCKCIVVRRRSFKADNTLISNYKLHPLPTLFGFGMKAHKCLLIWCPVGLTCLTTEGVSEQVQAYLSEWVFLQQDRRHRPTLGLALPGVPVMTTSVAPARVAARLSEFEASGPLGQGRYSVPRSRPPNAPLVSPSSLRVKQLEACKMGLSALFESGIFAMQGIVHRGAKLSASSAQKVEKNIYLERQLARCSHSVS